MRRQLGVASSEPRTEVLTTDFKVLVFSISGAKILRELVYFLTRSVEFLLESLKEKA